MPHKNVIIFRLYLDFLSPSSSMCLYLNGPLFFILTYVGDCWPTRVKEKANPIAAAKFVPNQAREEAQFSSNKGEDVTSPWGHCPDLNNTFSHHITTVRVSYNLLSLARSGGWPVSLKQCSIT